MDGRATRATGRRRAWAIVAVAAGLALAGCGGDGDGDAAPTTTTTSTSSTTEAPTTSTSTTTTTTSTTEAAGPTGPTGPGGGGDELRPGDPCSLEEGIPDCIDPDGDGQGTYLLDGDGCIAGAPDPALCTDLDGDGYAGYPDSEGVDGGPGSGETADLPACGTGVPVPCRRPDGSVDEG